MYFIGIIIRLSFHVLQERREKLRHCISPRARTLLFRFLMPKGLKVASRLEMSVEYENAILTNIHLDNSLEFICYIHGDLAIHCDHCDHVHIGFQTCESMCHCTMYPPESMFKNQSINQ